MDAVKEAAGTVAQNVAETAAAAKEAVTTGALDIACAAAEKEVKKQTSKAIKVTTRNVPGPWIEWIAKTGVNSLCNPDTWVFLEESSYNATKVDLWNERGIKKIVMTVKADPEDFTENWKVCEVEWEAPSTTMTVHWYPHAKSKESEGFWSDKGAKKDWWCIANEIIAGLQIYQLPGKCFYKSDWVDNFDDVDPDSYFATGTTVYRRWLQFRRWSLVWYARPIADFNFQWCTVPPKQGDGSEFTFDVVTAIPTDGRITMPEAVQLPTLDVHLPDGVEQPAPPPALEEEDEAARDKREAEHAKSLPERRSRPANPFAPHGVIELNRLHVVAKGNKLILSGATIHHFWELEGGQIETEVRRNERLELKCFSNAQADSWAESLVASGAINDEHATCCAVA